MSPTGIIMLLCKIAPSVARPGGWRGMATAPDWGFYGATSVGAYRHRPRRMGVSR